MGQSPNVVVLRKQRECTPLVRYRLISSSSKPVSDPCMMLRAALQPGRAGYAVCEQARSGASRPPHGVVEPAAQFRLSYETVASQSLNVECGADAASPKVGLSPEADSHKEVTQLDARAE
eukprot:CAMPEP_0184384492 /NCGR_PEP_ID=MMETSP0007-20130409/7927_1 /TAXON_ID=97485 /ORGANISM="Prymnesium parvum, Strain Texoma1" /LENGTH=119 /DNA_ID=CAMNT_0026731359 /DNA_START=263 /DNA_END=620 /DNA_ORIENTATION=+